MQATNLSASIGGMERCDDDGDAEEGLSFLLGGLHLSEFTSVEGWEDSQDDDAKEQRSQKEGRCLLTRKAGDSLPLMRDEQNVSQSLSSPRPDKRIIFSQNERVGDPDSLYTDCYNRAFSPPFGTKVPVRIVDMSDVNNRGFALVATRQILRGEVIYVEQAAVASQIPDSCSSRNMPCDLAGVGTQDDETNISGRPLAPQLGGEHFAVRGCQHCFRSLEPASSVTCATKLIPKENESTVQPGPSAPASLPQSDLWPILEYKGRSWDVVGDVFSCCRYKRHFAIEQGTGRVVCQQCHALFCSKSCFDAHCNEMGNCCLCSAAVQAMVHQLRCNSQGNEAEAFVQPPLVLASRMFCAAVFKHRSQKSPSDLYGGMCGNDSDITPLELGVLEKEQHGEGRQFYSLKEPHAALCRILSLNDEEQLNVFPLSYLHRLAAIAARNSFGVATKSPFSTYYSGLIRSSGGRNTNCHKKFVNKVSIALGSDGSLQRDMDEKVKEKCMVELVAIFTLTARINHSCDPCAEVRSQQFADFNIDLFARRDIAVGEEITISYIDIGRNAGRSASSKHRRMRELKARYLFLCDCSKCTDGV